MRAVRVEQFGGPEVMMLVDAAELTPADLSPTQVLVELHAAGVNPVDTYIRAGTYPIKPQLPFTPGFDGAGTVLAMGRDVQGQEWGVGSRVWVCRSVTGTYARRCICEARSVAALPERVSFEHGAGAGVAGMTAWLALMGKGQIARGQRVLVHGASGGVGLACVQLASWAGCWVAGTSSSQGGRDLVREGGASFVADHSKEGYEAALMDASQGKGFDVIIEMLANVNLQRDLGLAAMRGRVVVVGNRGEIAFNPRATMAKDASIFGMSLMNATPEEWDDAQWEVTNALAEGVLRVHVRSVMDLQDAPRAHRDVLAGGAAGKIVLRTA